MLAEIGRRLDAEHPQITEPSQYTRQTCASWAAAVDRMAVGDFSQWSPKPATVIRIKGRNLRVRVAERAQDALEVAAVLG